MLENNLVLPAGEWFGVFQTVFALLISLLSFIITICNAVELL